MKKVKQKRKEKVNIYLDSVLKGMLKGKCKMLGLPMSKVLLFLIMDFVDRKE